MNIFEKKYQKSTEGKLGKNYFRPRKIFTNFLQLIRDRFLDIKGFICLSIRTHFLKTSRVRESFDCSVRQTWVGCWGNTVKRLVNPALWPKTQSRNRLSSPVFGPFSTSNVT